jgi:hypothetical protein
MSEHRQELQTKIWKTKGSRFNAYRRLMRRHRLSYRATSLMSVYVIFLALIPSVLPDDFLKIDATLISVVTAFTAVAILVISLLEYAKSYELHADRLHQNAMQLSRLYDQLGAIIDRGLDEKRLGEEIDGINKSYHEMLNTVSENHEPGDYDLFKSQNRTHFELPILLSTFIRVRESVRTSFWYYFAIISFPIIVLILLLFNR